MIFALLRLLYCQFCTFRHILLPYTFDVVWTPLCGDCRRKRRGSRIATFSIFWRKILITFLTFFWKFSCSTVDRLILGRSGCDVFWGLFACSCPPTIRWSVVVARAKKSNFASAQFLHPNDNSEIVVFATFLKLTRGVIDWRLGTADIEGTLLH